MFKHMLILVFVVGMMSSSSVSFAQDNSTASCEATIKCVCQSLFKTRVVPCPTDNLPEHFFTDGGPPGTLGVDCSVPLTGSPALCEDLDIGCKWWAGEHQNCLLTLPLFVAPGQPVPTPSPTPSPTPAPCAHDPTSQGGPLDPNCDPCVAFVCSNDPFCCASAWDATCVTLYNGAQGSC